MLKKLIVISCLGLFIMGGASGQQKSGLITIKGQLKGFSNQTEIADLSEFQYLLPPSAERVIVPDADGNFSIKFKAAHASYYRLGRNTLYLSPGDNLEVYIDQSNPGLARFNGQGASANIYMKNTPFPKGGSFLEAGKNLKESPEATIAIVEEKANLRTKELAGIKNVSKEFIRLENARIKADLINSIYSGEVYGRYVFKLKDSAAKVYAENYVKAIASTVAKYSKGFIDPSLMKLVVYRDIAEEVIKQEGKTNDIRTISEWYAISTLVEDMQKVSDKKVLATFEPKIAQFKTESYKAAARKMLQKLMSFGKGDMAVDFISVDLNGNQVSLSSLKGKVIYVDLWATWCGPCMKEMPYYEKLKLQYKDNPNVVFVSLSIDDNEKPWKKSVEERKADGYQWLINRSKLQAYNIVGIPRSLLIDKDFKMVDMDAPMPSQPEVITAIDSLLK
ncbi:MAG: TlpA disulfide reductase family protein [Pedobacter sp.]|uniref:TlpA family protein disulfide reductase n=1 Tax=Pedobacter sp. TaxID=1411316 RepID=UPI0035644DC3